MSAAPNGSNGRHGYEPTHREGNTLGTIGFVLSLVGLIGCCIQPAVLVSLAGLIFSIMGLNRRPRGLAIAGTVLGVLGLLGVVAIFLMIGVAVLAFIPLLIAVAAMAGPEIETAVEEAILHQKVAQYIDQTGSMPVDITQIPDIDEKLRTDPWGTAYRLDVIDPGTEAFLIRSAGEDKVFDTEDDVTSEDN